MTKRRPKEQIGEHEGWILDASGVPDRAITIPKLRDAPKGPVSDEDCVRVAFENSTWIRERIRHHLARGEHPPVAPQSIDDLDPVEDLAEVWSQLYKGRSYLVRLQYCIGLDQRVNYPRGLWVGLLLEVSKEDLRIMSYKLRFGSRPFVSKAKDLGASV